MSAQSDRLTQRLARLSSRRRDAAAAAKRRQIVIQGLIRAASSAADTNPADKPDTPTVTTLSRSTTQRVGVYFRKDTYQDAKRAHYTHLRNVSVVEIPNNSATAAQSVG